MPGIVIELIGDERSYLRSAANTIATNTKLDASFKQVGVNANLSADAQIKAAVKAQEAMRANVAALSSRATSLPSGSKEQLAATALAADAQAKLARSYGVTTVASSRLSSASRTAERDLGKATRGTLAGATSALGLGRSLAFASGGFLAFAGGARILQSSIAGAENLEKAQAGLAVAIEHTGGNLAKLEPRYAATAKSAQQFGIDQADATTGLERATVLTGDAAKAQRAYQEALVISKATGKDFNAVLTATSKGQEGVTTSLKRYGILIATGTSGQKQYQDVFARFAGQARANTSESDRFNATLHNSEAIIGTALLPTFNKYVGEFGDWLTKMDESGRLQKDVNSTLHAAGDVFHLLGGAIGFVDKVTGSFGNTLKLLAAFKFASLVTGWASNLTTLAAKWGLVTTAATEAQLAEAGALGGGALGGAGRGVAAAAAGGSGSLPFLLGAGVSRAGAANKTLAARVGEYTGATGKAAADIGKSSSLFSRVGGGLAGVLAGAFTLGDQGEVGGTRIVTGPDGATYREDLWKGKVVNKVFLGIIGKPVILPGLSRGVNVPSFGLFPRGFPQPFRTPQQQPQQQGPFGTATPIAVYAQFQLTQLEQLAQARAGLTRGTADDVTAAKGVIARIKRLIDQGHLSGNSLVQALQSEASALGTIWSAEDAAAQKRAAAAQAAKARIQAQIENSIDPLSLEVALSRAEAFGKPVLPRLLALLAAARKALASGDLDLAQQKEALDRITSLKQQIKDARTTPTVTFTAPAKLQLSLAKDAALGLDQTKDLLKLKAAILQFIRTHKKNIGAEIDAYNQLASVNQQLGQTAQSALGLFKQASTRALTAGLGLTASQRAALRARLSQLGPGGTVPGTGVGAGGYAINPDTGRPIVVHTHVNIDGKRVADNTTRHQQKRRRRNPSQRRGPNAGG